MKLKFKKRIVLPILLLVVFLGGVSFKNDYFEIAKQIEIFTTLFKELNMNYVDETNPAALMDTAIKGMLSDLDPYTNFLNEQDVEEFKIRAKGEYSGIGAMVKQEDNKLLVVEPYKGYPADKAGLKAGDEITKIGDTNLSDFKDDATELLKGNANSEVAITYIRNGATKTTAITREEIEVHAVPFYHMVDKETGYIVLSKFNRKASEETENALKALKEKGAKRIVLDLRDNPGGLLVEAINVCNLFVAKGEVIVTTKSKVKKFNQEFKTRKNPVDTKIPLTVLVNGGSASASEIVSGALQDLDRAVILGAQSFGKGLVQRPVKLSYGTQLKVTISRYYTPSGRCIQALDYWHRDENGNAVRNTKFNEFKTKHGRTVYDGGGIIPDIEVNDLKRSSLTNAIEANDLVFDYATNYYYSHQLKSIGDFKFTDADFQKFKTFVAQSNFDYQTATENALQKVTDQKEFQELGPEVKADYEKMLKDIQQRKITAIDTYKGKLKKDLEDEIIKRYFYREGLYDYYINNDEAIIAATKLMENTTKFNKILK
ncbi:S41 family peptidase [Zhouia sp. PK063]|uniref:S41 family peptidase n=1 Tax=Zhouia sp. PK063 TaxID=3373602 RepID=UPI003788B339